MTCSLLSYSGTASAGRVQLQTLPSTSLVNSSVVPVASSLPPLMKDYLTYAAALKGLPERQSRRKIQELLERVSLLDVWSIPPWSPSPAACRP